MAGEHESAGGARPLRREAIIEAALQYIDEHGVEQLSMRKLGRELGVEGMALYYHVSDKDELLDGVASLILSEIELPSDDDWRSFLRQLGAAEWSVLTRHGHAAELVVARGSRPAVAPEALRLLNGTLRALRGGGFSAEAAHQGWRYFQSVVLGYVLQQVVDPVHGAASAEHAHRHRGRDEEAARHLEHLGLEDEDDVAVHLASPGFEEDFERALELVIIGLATLK